MLILCLVALLVVRCASATDYCTLCKDHTMCLYQDISIACSLAETGGGCSKNDIKTIVSKHNEIRNTVASGKEIRGNPGPQPPATNMKSLEWDEELAKIAQHWADQCKFDHDTCRKVSRFAVGQNMGQTSVFPCTNEAKQPNWIGIITDWYGEVADMDKKLVASYKSVTPTVGHYTQLVWATTTKIGCGYRYYETRDKWCSVLYVCNYGEGGNVLGQPVYKEGASNVEGESFAKQEGGVSIYDEATEPARKSDQEDSYTPDGTNDIYDNESDEKTFITKYAEDIYDENDAHSIENGDNKDEEAPSGIGDERELKTEMVPSERQAGDEEPADNKAEVPTRSSNQASSYSAQLPLLIAVTPFIVFFYV